MPAAPDEFQPTPDFLQRLSRRDRDAVATLARECTGLLLAHLRKTRRRHGLPEEDWQDVAQDVLAKFLADGAPRLDPSRPLMPYLRQMALNRARDLAKESRSRAMRDFDSGQQRLRAAVDASPLAKLAAADANRMIEAKLAMLSDGDQRVLRIFMQNQDGRHIVAIAKSERIDRGAAQMRYTRALQRLQATIENDREGGIRA